MNRESDDASTFTPLMPDGTRGSMMLSSSDAQKTKRSGQWIAVITDLTTGRHYEVEGAECSMPRCFCDASVLREVASPIETDHQKRKRLEARLAGITDQIASFQSSSRSLRLHGASRVVNGKQEDMTAGMLAMNDHILKSLVEEAESLRLALVSLDQ